MKIFAGINMRVQRYLERLLEKVRIQNAELEGMRGLMTRFDITWVEKLRLGNKITQHESKVSRTCRKYAVVYSMQQAVFFAVNLVKSYKCRLFPVGLMFLLLSGNFDGIGIFAMTTIINAVILFALLSVLMYAMKLCHWIPDVCWSNRKVVAICQSIFMLLAVVKVLYSILGFGALMGVAVVIIAIVVTGWICRNELRQLWKLHKEDKEDNR